MFSKILTGFLIFIMFSMIFAGLPGIAEAQESTTWTYMVYMSGDSSLASNVPADIQEMQEVGSGSGLEIIVLADTAGMDDSRLVRIIPGDRQDIPLTDIDPTWGNELEMGQAETLSQFVIWTAENYPADRYILDLWGHGTGWVGVCPDKGNYLECDELRSALEDVSDAGINLDIISMDACQMGMMEIAYELGGLADYAVLSEKDVPLDGWPYDRLLNLIKENSEFTVEEFGIHMVDAYMNWGLVNSRYSLTLSFIDLSHMNRVAGGLNAFAGEAEKMTGYFNQQFIEARSDTEEYDGHAQYDVRHLLANINLQTNCMSLEILVRNITEALNDAIVYERHWTNIQDEPAEYAYGLSIWFPSYSPSPSYLDCSFAQNTDWDEFLAALAPFFQNPGRQEIIYNVQVIGLDSDENGLKDSIQINYDANSVGTTFVDIHGPNGAIINSLMLDTLTSGNQTIELENFGSYSVAVYLRDNTGDLQNYSYFQDGLAKDGVSVISGQVTSDIGRGLPWTQVSLVNSQGTVIASTNTDRVGHYSMQVIVPTDTDGSNLTLICGLGDIQQNITIEELTDLNILNFQLDTSNDYLGWLIPIIAIIIVAGLICLMAWAFIGRHSQRTSPLEKEETEVHIKQFQTSAAAFAEEDSEITEVSDDTSAPEEKFY